MKKILVYDCAAESGGALTVLNSYYERLSKEKESDVTFVTSIVSLNEKENIHNIRLPWVKKSWLHRLYCDWFYMPKLVKKLQVDEVLSLQNIGIPRCKAYQTVYVHNAIPFTEIKFRLNEDRFLWLYQNFIGRLTISSLKKADNVIVQTEWMKKAIMTSTKISENQITVEEVVSSFPTDTNRINTEVTIFFYPAAAHTFKNHKIICEACKLLKKRGIDKYKVVFTLNEDENEITKALANDAKHYDIPIDFVGMLNRDEMIEQYKKSVLIFPSYLETVGLPLMEAQSFSAPIIAADCEYAHDAVRNYEKCQFFKFDDSETLSTLMEMRITNKNGNEHE